MATVSANYCAYFKQAYIKACEVAIANKASLYRINQKNISIIFEMMEFDCYRLEVNYIKKGKHYQLVVCGDNIVTTHYRYAKDNTDFTTKFVELSKVNVMREP